MPDITVVSGWQDKSYLSVSRMLRKQGYIVVSGFDGQWHGTYKQIIASVLGSLGFFDRYFSHAWVAGAYQYEYARKLGFRKQNIIFDLLSADLTLFQNAYHSTFQKKSQKYPHRFLFVGRFEPTKGLDTLISAWNIIKPERKAWELHVIGNGSLKNSLAEESNIVVKDFMQPDQLINEIKKTGCFILPSIGEPWGVVVHEFAAGGLPLIVSDVVGAAASFLVHGMNGYRFKMSDPSSLADCMRAIISMPDQQLCKMGEESHRISQRITPETSAKNLLSLSKMG